MMWKLLSVVVLVIAVILSWKHMNKYSSLRGELEAEYDYIVVGAGSAGCVIASRLTEDADVTVTLLEAGKEETDYPFTSVPLAFSRLQKSDADWAYTTVPQENACNGMRDRRCPMPRGKMLGGTGSLNNMVYARGSRHDYDRWANVFGADGWSYQDVLPYFIKSERHTDPELMQSAYHGTEGPWAVGINPTSPQLVDMYLNAHKELGYKVFRDFNGKEQVGFSPTSTFILNGVRQSSSTAFLRPAMNRDNLHILTQAQVTRVLFDGIRAMGVEYVKNGRLKTVRARKEVILSAGAIGSPHILMLSGIGHKVRITLSFICLL